jgi:hypothetical protein
MNTSKKQISIDQVVLKNIAIKLYIVLLIICVGAIWFSQNSINAYWQQTYHKSSPIETLNNYPLWQQGGVLASNLNQHYDDYNDWFESKSDGWAITMNKKFGLKNPADYLDSNGDGAEQIGEIISDSAVATDAKTESSNEITSPSESSTIIAAEASISSNNHSLESPKLQPSANIAYANPGTKVVLHAGDKVFFAGDSMMQGVAPFVEQTLRKKYGLSSINLSKQSTGLSYPKFFDWPSTIEKTLAEHSNIRLLVVFLGPNDPWDFPDPQKSKGAPYLRFSTPEWEQVYRQRVDRVIRAANKANVHVIWVGVPHMKASKLNNQMSFMNGLLQSELNGKAIWLPTSKMLSNGDNQYSDTIMLNGKSVRVRSKDGIHFTGQGQQYLANYVLQYIYYGSAEQSTQSEQVVDKPSLPQVNSNISINQNKKSASKSISNLNKNTASRTTTITKQIDKQSGLLESKIPASEDNKSSELAVDDESK